MPSHVVAQQVAFLPQQQQIPAGLTVRQLVALGRSPYQTWWQWEPTAKDLGHISHALAATQLDSFGDRPLSELSGGEQQRAFLALALAQTPLNVILPVHLDRVLIGIKSTPQQHRFLPMIWFDFEMLL